VFCTGSVYVSVFLYNDHVRGLGEQGGCGTPERRYTAWAGHCINFSFIVLFLQFFRRSYSKKSGNRRADKAA